jgi:hypothetical protein
MPKGGDRRRDRRRHHALTLPRPPTAPPGPLGGVFHSIDLSLSAKRDVYAQRKRRADTLRRRVGRGNVDYITLVVGVLIVIAIIGVAWLHSGR